MAVMELMVMLNGNALAVNVVFVGNLYGMIRSIKILNYAELGICYIYCCL